MKHILLGAALIATCFGKDLKIMEVIEECAKANGLAVQEYNIRSSNEEVTNNVKCTKKCILNKLDVFNDADQFVPQAFRDKFFFIVDDVEEVINSCGDIRGVDACDTAHKLVACYRPFETTPSRYMQKLYEECAKANGITLEDFTDQSRDDEVTNNIKCTKKCILNKVGLFDTQDKFVPQVARDRLYFLFNDVEEFINSCKDVRGLDACDTAHKFFACMLKMKDNEREPAK